MYNFYIHECNNHNYIYIYNYDYIYIHTCKIQYIRLKVLSTPKLTMLLMVKLFQMLNTNIPLKL